MNNTTPKPVRQSIFTPVWRSAIDPSAAQAQAARWDANPPASSL